MNKIIGIVLSFALVLILLGCVEPSPVIQACKGEGGAVPVIADPPECCAGLILILPKEAGIVGISGYCTANCGNGTCDAIESEYNCPTDCTAGVTPSPATGTFVLLISDAEANIEDFESVNVTFSTARIFPVDSVDTNDSGVGDDNSGENGSGEENGGNGFETIDLNGVTVDLTQVIGEKAISVLEVELETGTYSKVELTVESVEATLLDGNAADVKIPSENLKIVKQFTIDEGEETKFVFDIQVVKKGSTDEYNLLPVISKSGVVGEDLPEDEVEVIDEEGEVEVKQPVETGTFVLLLSDAEADIEDFESVNVTFDSVRIFSSGNDTNGDDNNESSGFETVDLNGVTVDLTTVVGEKAVPIVELELQAGKYNKIELSVESVEATLLDGNAAVVKIPSNKLKITKTFTVDVNSETKFVFDIQVVKSGSSDEYNLLPVVSKSGVIGEDLDEDEIVEIEPLEENGTGEEE